MLGSFPLLMSVWSSLPQEFTLSIYFTSTQVGPRNVRESLPPRAANEKGASVENYSICLLPIRSFWDDFKRCLKSPSGNQIWIAHSPSLATYTMLDFIPRWTRQPAVQFQGMRLGDPDVHSFGTCLNLLFLFPCTCTGETHWSGALLDASSSFLLFTLKASTPIRDVWPILVLNPHLVTDPRTMEDHWRGPCSKVLASHFEGTHFSRILDTHVLIARFIYLIVIYLVEEKNSGDNVKTQILIFGGTAKVLNKAMSMMNHS